MVIGLIIVHWNRPDECVRTVEAFRSQIADIELLILDNHSGVAEYETLRRVLPDVEILRLERNIGFGPAMNLGIKHYLDRDRYEWLILAPHDALPQPDCLQRLFSELTIRPRAGIGCAEYGQARCPTFSWYRGAVSRPCTRGIGWQGVDFPNGTLMIYRVSMLRDVGLFDERYFAYNEETEIGYRAQRSGWEVGMVWGAVVTNPIRQASSRVTRYLLYRNGLLATCQIYGRFAAATATLLNLANAVRFAVFPRLQPEGYSTALRLRALKDFWLGRLGRPPEDLF